MARIRDAPCLAGPRAGQSKRDGQKACDTAWALKRQLHPALRAVEPRRNERRVGNFNAHALPPAGDWPDVFQAVR